MRYLLTLILTIGFAVAQTTPKTTPWSRSFLLSTTASEGRTALEVGEGGEGGGGPTWDVLQTFQAGATVFGTLTATNIAGTVLDLLELSSAPATPASGRGRIYAKTDGSVYYLDDTGVSYNLIFSEASASLLYQATNSALTALSSNPAMYQATNSALTALAAFTPTTWQATNANLTALATDPTIYQATNANLTALASNPQLYQATNAALTALAGNPNLYQATNANLTALAGNPSLYQSTNANLTLLSAFGPTTWQATNATLTALVADPNRYHATNVNLTTLSASDAVLALHANPSLYQSSNTVLTTLASMGPNTWQATNANLTLLSAFGPTTWQATNTVLTTLASLGPNTWQATNATLTSLSTNTISGTGLIVLKSITDGIISDMLDLSTLVENLDFDTTGLAQLNATNSEPIAFSDLDIEGPVGFKRTDATGAVIELDWETDVDVWVYPNDTVSFGQTGSAKPGQRMVVNVVNTNAFAVETVVSSLDWDWQREISVIPANSWASFVAIKDSVRGNIHADASAPSATLTVDEGGSGRVSHPQNYVLIGDVSNPLKAAAITNGLTHSGTGQAMTIGLDGFQQGLSSLSITTATAGVSVLTNSLVLATNTSVQISGKWLFSGDTNTVGGVMLANYRFGATLSVTNNNFKAPSGSGLWAYWTTNSTFYPVLQIGGIDNEPGRLSLWDIQQRPVDLLVVSTPAVTYLAENDFESTAPDGWNTVLGSPDYDYGPGEGETKIAGTESLRMAGSARTRPNDWSDKSGVLIKFRLRLQTGHSISDSYLLCLDPAGTDSTTTVIYLASNGRLGVDTDGISPSYTTATMGAETSYYVWVRYYKSSGSTDGIMSVAFATTDSEPTEGTAYRGSTVHTQTDSIGRMQIRSSTGADILIDDVQVTEWDGE